MKKGIGDKTIGLYCPHTSFHVFFLNKKAKKQRNITDNEKKNRPNKTRNLRENLHIVDSKRCKVLKCGTNRTASKKLTIE